MLWMCCPSMGSFIISFDMSPLRTVYTSSSFPSSPHLGSLLYPFVSKTLLRTFPSFLLSAARLYFLSLPNWLGCLHSFEVRFLDIIALKRPF